MDFAIECELRSVMDCNLKSDMDCEIGPTWHNCPFSLDRTYD